MPSTHKVKHSGQVFTPDFLVENILDYAGYSSGGILCRHIIDNSCGDGAFICTIVRRYCTEFLRTQTDRHRLAEELATYVHGIELDPKAHSCCLENLRTIELEWQLPAVTWDIRLADALTTPDYDRRMDFVVGNPPYVRVHNLDETYASVKTYAFASGGMTDLYLVFFEIGLRMLSPEGRLCYITPSSWINSLAGTAMRQHLAQTQCLSMVVDLAHFQAFKATTYTMITLLEPGHQLPEFDYYRYNDQLRERQWVARLTWREALIEGTLYLGTPKSIRAYTHIVRNNYQRWVTVKNGFATLADKVFIAPAFPFEEYVIPVLKASTGRWGKAFFPYNAQGKPYTREELFASSACAHYLNAHKKELLKGAQEADVPTWYLYGRTQALKDVAVDKVAINTVIKDKASVKLHRVPAGAGLYSGLYILGNVPYEHLHSLLVSDSFIDYIALLKKYKSGGYYTFNSKDLEVYLNYHLSQQNDGQSNVPEGYLRFIS